MVSIKAILLLGILSAVFSNIHAMKIRKREVNGTARLFGSSEYDDENNAKLDGNQYTCQGYYECMNKMQSKERILATMKAEHSTLLATMTSVNKKALEQERLLNKLIPKNKLMRRELEELADILEDCEEKSNQYINDIAILEADLAKYINIVDEVIGMCSEQVNSLNVVRTATGVYHYSTASTSTFWEAQNECKRNGMNLITIDSIEERDFIRGYIETEYGSDISWSWTWIGLQNYETADDDYVWIGTGGGLNQDTSDGTIDVEDWGTGEPGTSSTNNCVGYELTDTAGVYTTEWVTDDCTGTGHYICELPPICYHLFDIQFRMLGRKD